MANFKSKPKAAVVVRGAAAGVVLRSKLLAEYSSVINAKAFAAGYNGAFAPCLNPARIAA